AAPGAPQPRGASSRARAGGGAIPDDARSRGTVMTPVQSSRFKAQGSRAWFLVLGSWFAATVACAQAPKPDAYGNVEATEVVVSAEAGGRIAALKANEGDRIAEDAVVGSIEATELTLARDQVAAQRAATASRVDEVARQ